jgi:dihydroneopterin aldolase
MGFHDWIWIREIEVDCVVGVYGHERTRVQPLRVQVGLCLDTEPAARSERLRDSVDYEALAAQVTFLLTSCRFRMLETAAHVLSRYLLAPPAPGEARAQIERVRLRLDKPGALDGVVVPTLEIEREKSWVTLGQEQKPFGTVDVIQETRDAGVYRLNVAPGARIPLHVHRRMQESEMVLGKGLWCQGRPVAAGTVHRWPLGAAHCYDNPTRRVQSILCVDAPPFIESDEIAVEGEPAQVRPEGAARVKLGPEA